MAKIDPNSIVKRAKDVPFSRLDDEMLAIDSQAGYCYSLNKTAGRIWELIAAPVSVKDLCAALQKEFDVDEETCRNEVVSLLRELAGTGLVETVHPGKN